MKNTAKVSEKTINAEGKTLGRLATEVAVSLIGKDSASFERHIYSGGKVKVLNASKIKVTAKKMEDMLREKYSGHRGGLKILNWKEVVAKKGYRDLVLFAVKGMLPKNRLQKKMLASLTVEE